MEATGPNSSQIDYWNGAAGDRWTRHSDSQDNMADALGLAAMEACDIHAGHTVLDVGCGVGTTTLQIARRVGAKGRVLGIDLPGQMLQVGRERLDASGLDNVVFEHTDIAAYPFETQTIDRAYSRFGVMFFSDPVAAFRNIRRGMTSGGRLAFVCWQAVKKNPRMNIPIDITLRFVEPPQPPAPDAPGPVSFADPERVRRILSDAGFDGITMEGVEMNLPIAADAPLTAQRLIQMGSASRLLANASDDIKTGVEDALCEGVAGYQTDGGVMLGGATWIVTANTA